MKRTSKILLVIIILVLSLVIISLLMDGQRIERTIETIKDDYQGEEIQRKIKELELGLLKMEDKNLNLELSHNDFVRDTQAQLERLEELLNKTDALETVYGLITSISGDQEISFNILTVEVDDLGEYIPSERNRLIRSENDFTAYLISETGLVSSSQEKFLNTVENEIQDNNQMPYTFKIVKGKAVQIYQGYVE